MSKNIVSKAAFYRLLDHGLDPALKVKNPCELNYGQRGVQHHDGTDRVGLDHFPSLKSTSVTIAPDDSMKG